MFDSFFFPGFKTKQRNKCLFFFPPRFFLKKKQMAKFIFLARFHPFFLSKSQVTESPNGLSLLLTKSQSIHNRIRQRATEQNIQYFLCMLYILYTHYCHCHYRWENLNRNTTGIDKGLQNRAFNTFLCLIYTLYILLSLSFPQDGEEYQYFTWIDRGNK